MPNPTCFQTIQVNRLRIARLTDTGAPLTGAGNGYVTDSIEEIGIALDIEEGEEFIKKNGGGKICARKRDDDSIKGATLSMSLCQYDYQILSLITGADRFTSGGNIVGFQVPKSTAPSIFVSVEAWTTAWDGTGVAIPSFTTPDAAYHHFVFPKVRWTIADHTLNSDFTSLPFTGIAEENTRITANGPFDDWPVAVRNGNGVTSSYGVFLDPVLPAASCSFITVTSAAS